MVYPSSVAGVPCAVLVAVCTRTGALGAERRMGVADVAAAASDRRALAVAAVVLLEVWPPETALADPSQDSG